MEYVQRELPYVRSFVLRSVYGVLRQEGITFGEEEPGRVIAEWREDGTDVSLSITAEEKAFGTELTVSLRRPCDGIPAAPPLRRDTGAESVPASAGDAGPDRPAFGKYPDDERGGRRLKNAASGDRRCEK